MAGGLNPSAASTYANNDLQEFMNDIGNKNHIDEDLIQGNIPGSLAIEDNFVSKPKILKGDSSKYVKQASKKSGGHQQQKAVSNPINNLMQSVQENLSQILNPASTFNDSNANAS